MIVHSKSYVPKKRVYRHGEQRRTAIGVAVGTPIVFGVMAIVVSPYLLFGAVFLLWYSCVMWRIAVLLSSDGVRVRNMFRTRRFTWAEIDRFGWGDSGRWPGRIGGAYLRDGVFVYALALSYGTDRVQGVESLLAGLNEELAGARAAAGLPVTNLDFVAPSDFGASNQMSLDVEAADGRTPERSQNE